MNIFVLSEDPREAATMMCDKHIPKMIVESGQMLCTAHRLLDGQPVRGKSKSGLTTQTYFILPEPQDTVFYKTVHKYHPCTTWTLSSESNYLWHYEHFLALGEEFKFRFNKDHLTINKLGHILKTPPVNIPKVGLTPFAQAMSHYPECMVKDNAVKAYRNYYHFAKPFAKWQKGRNPPTWWEGYKGN